MEHFDHEYEIELKYHCPGTREGILLCVFGVLLFIGSVLFDKSVKGREKKKHV